MLLFASIACLVGAIAPTTAFGSDVNSTSSFGGLFKDLRFRDSGKTDNELTLRSTQRRVSFVDPAAPIRAGRHCRYDDVRTVSCAFAPGSGTLDATLAVSTGKGSDTIRPRLHLSSSRAPIPPGILLESGPGSDVIGGSVEPSRLVPGLGEDVARGGRGQDVFAAEARRNGDERIDGADQMYGGLGLDLLDYSSRVTAVSIHLGKAETRHNGARRENDLIRGFEVAVGGAGSDKLVGNRSGNAFVGLRGADRISSGRGRDSVAGGRNRDRIDVGAGNDYVFECCDHARDIIDCGPGRDRADVGKRDVVRRCEEVSRGVILPSFKDQMAKQGKILPPELRRLMHLGHRPR